MTYRACACHCEQRSKPALAKAGEAISSRTVAQLAKCGSRAGHAADSRHAQLGSFGAPAGPVGFVLHFPCVSIIRISNLSWISCFGLPGSGELALFFIAIPVFGPKRLKLALFGIPAPTFRRAPRRAGRARRLPVSRKLALFVISVLTLRSPATFRISSFGSWISRARQDPGELGSFGALGFVSILRISNLSRISSFVLRISRFRGIGFVFHRNARFWTKTAEIGFV